MSRILACIFLSLGTVLIVFGLNFLDSIRSAFSRLFSDGPTDKAIWFLLAGVGFIVVGMIILLLSPRPHRFGRSANPGVKGRR